jgi:hypothetical protein
VSKRPFGCIVVAHTPLALRDVERTQTTTKSPLGVAATRGCDSVPGVPSGSTLRGGPTAILWTCRIEPVAVSTTRSLIMDRMWVRPDCTSRWTTNAARRPVIARS